MLENATISNILVGTGTGIFSSGLTAGLIDLANYIEFNKKEKVSSSNRIELFVILHANDSKVYFGRT